MIDLTPLLKSQEVARIIGITAQSLDNWRCAGKGPRYVKDGEDRRARVYYRPVDVQTWIEDRLTGGEGS